LLDICDEIMARYSTIDSMNHRPHQSKTNVAVETTHESRDEEEIAQDAKNKLRLVLSNGSAPVFPTYRSDEKRYKYGLFPFEISFSGSSDRNHDSLF
jgi:hypothetical protein